MQRHSDDLVVVVSDGESFVGVNKALLHAGGSSGLSGLALGRHEFAHHSPQRQVIDVHLVPIVLNHSISEPLHRRFIQH